MSAEQQKPQSRQPRNIFEQIAAGLEVTNQNVVDIAADLAEMYKMVQEIHSVLFPPQTDSEPNAVGAEPKDEE